MPLISFRLLTSLVLLSGVVTTPTNSYAQDPVSAIAAGSAVNGLIDNLRESLREILTKLDQSVSSGTFLARMQVSNLLAEIDYRATGILGKTFDQLDKEQQVFFRNTQQTVADLKALGDQVAENADAVVQRIEFTIASIPFTSTEPRLRSSRPRVVQASVATQPVRITFDGSWLANGPPRLNFGNINCDIADVAEPKVTFTCPAKVFSGDVSGNVRFVSGNFSAVQKASFWNKIMNLFGSRPPMKNYPVSVGVVSDTFGNAKVVATVASESFETSQRSHPYDTGAEHCRWGSETLVNIAPAGPEWMIDVASINLVLASGERSELRNVTAQGFQVYAVGHNSGNCVKVAGQLISKDARGWANGHVSWSEKKKKVDQQAQPIFEGEVGWGDSRVISVPESMRSYIVSLVLFNGRTRQYNAPAKDEFFILERDDENRSLKLLPRSLAEAFK